MIDLRVMNNFSYNEQAAILENLARSVCEIDRAFDTIAKTKLLCQAHRRVSHGNDSTGPPNLFDDIAPVVGFDLLLHGRHNVRRTQVHSLAGSCAAGNQVRTHKISLILLLFTSPFVRKRQDEGWLSCSVMQKPPYLNPLPFTGARRGMP